MSSLTARDRMVLIVVVILAVLGAGWLLVVSPQRKQASKLAGEVSAANSQLASAEGQLASARTAQARYATAYASIVRLGKAVPPGREVPSLVYQLAQATSQKHVEFSSIVNGANGSSGGSSSSSSASAAATATSLAGFTQMPFTFVFTGGFEELSHLFGQLNQFTVRTADGGLRVNGRLLTIQSVKLTPANNSGAQAGGANQQLTGTISATAYVLPAAQGLTGGANSASPVSTSGSSTGQSASSGASSPTAPAIAKVTP